MMTMIIIIIIAKMIIMKGQSYGRIPSIGAFCSYS